MPSLCRACPASASGLRAGLPGSGAGLVGCLFGGVCFGCCLCLCCRLRWLPCLPVVLLLFGLAVAGRPCCAASGFFVGAFFLGRGCVAGVRVVVPSRGFAVFAVVVCFAVFVGFACGLCGWCVAVARGSAFAVVGGLRSCWLVAVGRVSLVLVALAGVSFSGFAALICFWLCCPSASVGGFLFGQASFKLAILRATAILVASKIFRLSQNKLPRKNFAQNRRVLKVLLFCPHSAKYRRK